MDSENWEANFLMELGQDNTCGNDRIDESDSETPGEELPPPKITSYSEAIDSIENVQKVEVMFRNHCHLVRGSIQLPL